jgi:uncharacterized protein YggE
MQVAVFHRGSSMRDAVAGVESARAALVAAAGELVVSSSDLGVWAVRDEEGRPAGFEARHSFSVTGADLGAASDLLGRLPEEMADRLQVESVTMWVSEPGEALRQAREAAYSDALARAEHLASLAGATLGEVQSVIEGKGAPVPFAKDASFAGTLRVSLEPGQSTIAVALEVTWALAEATA